jgi:hypothetical protein
MNEAEWLASQDPAAMLNWVTGREKTRPFNRSMLSDRKLRLFACACMRLTGEQPKYGSDWLSVWEVDGQPMDHEPAGQPLLAAQSWAEPGPRSVQFATLLRCIVGNPFRPVTLPKKRPCCPRCGSERWVPVEPESVMWCRDCNERWGWPKDAYSCPWKTTTVLALAQTAYDERLADGPLDPHQLLVLSDALEEAGVDAPCKACEGKGAVEGDAGKSYITGLPIAVRIVCGGCDGTGRVPHPLLAYLRSPGPHVRGCHALDAILGQS